jgi:YnfA/UPF0060 family uncharacterized protein
MGWVCWKPRSSSSPPRSRRSSAAFSPTCGPIWLLLPAAASLALFVWLLTLHPAASGRVYAAYGGVYVATALIWLRLVDGVRLVGVRLHRCRRRARRDGDHRPRVAWRCLDVSFRRLGRAPRGAARREGSVCPGMRWASSPVPGTFRPNDRCPHRRHGEADSEGQIARHVAPQQMDIVAGAAVVDDPAYRHPTRSHVSSSSLVTRRG